EASKLVPIGSTPSCAKAAPRRKTSEELDAEWREWQQAGKSHDDFLEFLRERDAQRPSYQDDDNAALRARVAELEARQAKLHAKIVEAANIGEADSFELVDYLRELSRFDERSLNDQ